MRTIGESLEAYLKEHERWGRAQADSRKTTAWRLRAFIEPAANHPPSELEDLLPRLVAAYAETRAVATVLGAIREAKGWTRFLAFKRVMPRSPWESEDMKYILKTLPKPKRRKTSLKIDESRLFLAECLRVARKKPRSAEAALATELLVGLRASEGLRIAPMHLDDNGRVLRLEGVRTKSDSGEEALELPPEVQALVQAAARGLAADERLWPFTRQTLRKQCRKVCKRIGIQVVGPQSLRCTHATLAIAGGSSLETVASSLGQGSTEVTRRHYVEAGTLESLAARTVARKLVG